MDPRAVRHDRRPHTPHEARRERRRRGVGGASAELVCAFRCMPDRLSVYLPVWSAAQTLDTHTLSNRRYAPNLDGQATAESLSSRTLMTDFHQCLWPDGKGPDDMPQALIVSIAMVSIVMVSIAIVSIAMVSIAIVSTTYSHSEFGHSEYSHSEHAHSECNRLSGAIVEPATLSRAIVSHPRALCVCIYI